MIRNDEDEVLGLCCGERVQEDCSISMGQECNSATVALFGRGCGWGSGVVGDSG